MPSSSRAAPIAEASSEAADCRRYVVQRRIDREVGGDQPPCASRLRAARDARVDGRDERAPAVQHRVLADDEQLAGRMNVDGVHRALASARAGAPAAASAQAGGRSTTRAPSPGADSSTRSTPGTEASAARTAAADDGAHSTFTCGPASIEKYASVPRSRSDHTSRMTAIVAGSQ